MAVCITVIWSFRSSNNNVDKLMRVEVGFFNYLFFLRRRKERLIFENFLKRLVILSNLFISQEDGMAKNREKIDAMVFAHSVCVPSPR